MPLSQEDVLAGLADAGFTAALVNSDAELRNTVNAAVSQQWTPAKFKAEIQNTLWWRNRADTVRQWDALTVSDPNTASARRDGLLAQLRDQAAQVGVQVDDARLRIIAESALRFGFQEAQVRDLLAAEYRYNPGRMQGSAAAAEDQVRQIAAAYDFPMTDGSVGDWVGRIVRGDANTDGFKNAAVAFAKQKYSWIADDLDAGRTVRDVADPYIAQAAKLLELSADQIGLSDPQVQRAMSFRDKSGKMGLMESWRFDEQLRQDQRWMKTNNAREQAMSTGRAVLQAWGVVS